LINYSGEYAIILHVQDVNLEAKILNVLNVVNNIIVIIAAQIVLVVL